MSFSVHSDILQLTHHPFTWVNLFILYSIHSIFIIIMRQIETNMNQAIRSLLSGGSTNWASSNTTVTKNPNNGNVTVLLHGNHIATISNDFVAIYDGGWQSNTTKSRLNALLSEFRPHTRVFQKNYEWFISYAGKTFDFVSGSLV